jgi:transposase InsO family protein
MVLPLISLLFLIGPSASTARGPIDDAVVHHDPHRQVVLGVRLHGCAGVHLGEVGVAGDHLLDRLQGRPDRLYKEERLSVRRRGGRKRALGTRVPLAIPQDRNLRWSLDFVMDTFVSGRRFRILAVVDDFTRECLGLVADTSLTGPRVVRELDRIVEIRGRRLSAYSSAAAS